MRRFCFQILFLLFMFMATADCNRDNVCNNAFGLENGQIKDHQISASSYVSHLYIYGKGSVNTKAKYGRLNGDLAWCGINPTGRLRHQSPYFQVDFGQTVKVNGIATQGLPNMFSYYVKSYNIRFSRDGNHWSDYSTPNKVWHGNNDTSTIRSVIFDHPVITNYLRIYPLTYSYRICLRVEVYGCHYANETGNSTQSSNMSTVQPASSAQPELPRHVSTTSLPTMKETQIFKSAIEIFSKPLEYVSPSPVVSVSQNTKSSRKLSSRPHVINSTSPTGVLASTVSHQKEHKSLSRPHVINSTSSTLAGLPSTTVSHQKEHKSLSRPHVINSPSPTLEGLPSTVSHREKHSERDGESGIRKINIIIIVVVIGFVLLCLLTLILFCLWRGKQKTEICYSEFIVLTSVDAVSGEGFAKIPGKIPEKTQV